MDPPKTQKKKQTGSQRVLLRGEYLNFDLLDGDMARMMGICHTRRRATPVPPPTRPLFRLVCPLLPVYTGTLICLSLALVTE